MRALLDLLRQAWSEIRRRKLFFTLFPIVLAACGALTFRFDVQWSNALMLDRSDALRGVARRFSAIGDYPIGTLLFMAILWVAGHVWKKPQWKTAALAALLAATLAGLTATTMRTLAGRPRPSANMADGFYGPHIDRRFASFGSAHSATSLATSTALAVAAPDVGIPLLVLSLGVPWARFYMHDHYATDILAGGGIGIWFGLALGFAARAICGKERARSRIGF